MKFLYVMMLSFLTSCSFFLAHPEIIEEAIEVEEEIVKDFFSDTKDAIPSQSLKSK